MLADRIEALPGWSALVDVQTAIGTVPLVAVGPAGAFAIERGTGPAPETLAAVPERALMHAWAQARHLERRWLGCPVTPVLALEGELRGRRRGVELVGADAVDGWLAGLPAILSPGEVAHVLARLDDAPRAVLVAA